MRPCRLGGTEASASSPSDGTASPCPIAITTSANTATGVLVVTAIPARPADSSATATDSVRGAPKRSGMPARIVRLAITPTPNTGITSDPMPVPCSVAAAAPNDSTAT